LPCPLFTGFFFNFACKIAAASLEVGINGVPAQEPRATRALILERLRVHLMLQMIHSLDLRNIPMVPDFQYLASIKCFSPIFAKRQKRRARRTNAF
jgi:hypothetical protein